MFVPINLKNKCRYDIRYGVVALYTSSLKKFHPLEISRTVQNIREHSNTFQNVPVCSRSFGNTSEHSRSLRNVLYIILTPRTKPGTPTGNSYS